MTNKFDMLKQQQDNSDRSDSSGSSEDDGSNNTLVDLGPVECPPGEHKLQHAYCLWYSKRPTLVRNAQLRGTEGYSQILRLIGQIGTVEQWWGLYSHIIRISDLSLHTDLHLFKKGIQPMWEDPANSRGGKWVIRLKKGYAPRAWENLCMAMLGEQFMAGNEICGVVISVRYQEDLLSIWNRTASDQITTSRIRDALKRLLNLPLNATMEYKTHNESLKASKSVPPTSTKS